MILNTALTGGFFVALVIDNKAMYGYNINNISSNPQELQMKKRIIAAILCALCAITLFACKNDTVHEGFYLADAPSASFDIYLPDDWAVDISTATVVSHPKNDGKAGISVMAESYDPSINTENKHPIDAYFDSYKETVESTFDNVSYTQSGEAGKLGDNDAKIYEYTADIGGVKYCVYQLITVKGAGVMGAEVYIFTYSAVDGSYLDYLPSAQKIAEYIEIK